MAKPAKNSVIVSPTFGPLFSHCCAPASPDILSSPGPTGKERQWSPTLPRCPQRDDERHKAAVFVPARVWRTTLPLDLAMTPAKSLYVLDLKLMSVGVIQPCV